eukprot:11222407-Lingulodinium_polyedra.AAC.1
MGRPGACSAGPAGRCPPVLLHGRLGVLHVLRHRAMGAALPVDELVAPEAVAPVLAVPVADREHGERASV